MSIVYNKLTNFTAKDTMGSTNPDKILSGVPFDAEFNAISAAFQLAAPEFSPTFTGMATFNNVTINGTTAVGAVTASSAVVSGSITAATVNGSTTSTWDTAAATVTAKEAGWDATKSTVDTKEANWDATETTVNAGAANWDEAYSWGDHALAGYSGSDTTYSGGTNITLSGTTFNLDSSLTGLTDVTTSAVSIGSWEIKLEGSNLVFRYGGTDKFKIDTSGNTTASGNVTAYGSP